MREVGIGECIVTRFDDPVAGTRLRIDRADPAIWIAAEMLADITSSWEPVIEDGLHKGWTGPRGDDLHRPRHRAPHRRRERQRHIQAGRVRPPAERLARALA